MITMRMRFNCHKINVNEKKSTFAEKSLLLPNMMNLSETNKCPHTHKIRIYICQIVCV